MKSLLILTFLAPGFVFAGNLSAALTNPDIALIESGINYAPMSDYNVEKPNLANAPGGIQRVWSKEDGGYYLTVRGNGRFVSGISEVSRVNENDYVTRKVTYNENQSVKVISECDAIGGFGTDFICVTATPSLCGKIRKIYPNSQAMEKDFQACERLTTNMKKIDDIYTAEVATPAHKAIYESETASMHNDYAELTKSFKIMSSLNQKTFKISQDTSKDLAATGKRFSRLAKLCNVEQINEKPSWYSKTSKTSKSGNTSSQRGQR